MTLLFFRCNFKVDCPLDTGDEDGCPLSYDFEDCFEATVCGWTQMPGNPLEWIITTGQQVIHIRFEYHCTKQESFI